MTALVLPSSLPQDKLDLLTQSILRESAMVKLRIREYAALIYQCAFVALLSSSEAVATMKS
jgi:hypothetical protein